MTPRHISACLFSLCIAACSSSPCPSAIPAGGDRCSDGTAICEYAGTDTHGACATTAACAASSSIAGTTLGWALDLPAAGCGMTAPACPATFATASGVACGAIDGSTICDYAEGRCLCDPCQNAGTPANQWHCRAWTDVADGCPVPRPVAGTPCTADGLECNYAGNCCQRESLGRNLVCEGGKWFVDLTVDPTCSCLTPACL